MLFSSAYAPFITLKWNGILFLIRNCVFLTTEGTKEHRIEVIFLVIPIGFSRQGICSFALLRELQETWDTLRCDN